MEVDSVGIIVILSMSYITTRIVKTYPSVAKIPRKPNYHTKCGKNCHKILSVKIQTCYNRVGSDMGKLGGLTWQKRI